MPFSRLFALSLTVLSTTLVQAGGLHLGMKLACKRYGDAWNSGSRDALYAASTSDFAAIWGRMPNDLFAQMPRGGAAGVASSFKGGKGYGQVTVNTNQGVMTFILVGGGFNWRVADIQKTGDGGQWVSLKGYLDASLTAREFMASFHSARGPSDGDEQFHRAASVEFNAAFAGLADSDLARVRRVLPPPCLNCKPTLIFNGYSAEMTVIPPDGEPGDKISIRLAYEGGWKVNDFGVDTKKMQIASFQKSMPALACVTALGSFVENPDLNDPAEFTPPGELRDSLVYAKSQKPFPMKSGDQRTRLEISEDGKRVFAHYPGRLVRLSIGSGARPAVTKIEMCATQGKWSDVAQALALQKRVKEMSVASLLKLPFAESKTAAVASVLKRASAVENVVAKTVASAEKSAAASLAAPKRLHIDSTDEKRVEIASAVGVRKTTTSTKDEPVLVAVKADEKIAAAAPPTASDPASAPAAAQVLPVGYVIPQQPVPQYMPYYQCRRGRRGGR